MRYQAIFVPGSKMRDRLDAIMSGLEDPDPGSSGSEYVEKMMIALEKGHENPYGVMRLPTKVRPRKLDEYPVTRNVAQAFVEAFEILKERKGTS